MRLCIRQVDLLSPVLIATRLKLPEVLSKPRRLHQAPNRYDLDRNHSYSSCTKISSRACFYNIDVKSEREAH